MPPPKKHQQPKRSQSSTTFIDICFFLGGAYPPPPPKKKTQQPQKTPDPAFQQFPLTVFSSKRERWEKLHGERPNPPMPLPWSYVRSCKSWRRPQVPNARRNGGRWGRVLGRWFVKRREWGVPPNKKGWVACGFLGLNLFFCFVGKKREEKTIFC